MLALTYAAMVADPRATLRRAFSFLRADTTNIPRRKEVEARARWRAFDEYVTDTTLKMGPATPREALANPGEVGYALAFTPWYDSLDKFG